MRIRRIAAPCCFTFLLASQLADAKPPGRPAAATKRAAPAKKSAAKAPAAAASPATTPAPSAEDESSAALAPTAPSSPAAGPAPSAAASAAGAPPPAAVEAPPPTSVAAPPVEAVAPSPPALSPETTALAQRHFQAGNQAFQERKYDTALTEFTTAYEISKQPDLLHNLHLVAIKLGQKEMAIGYLREYIRYRPAETTTVQKQIDEISAADLKPEPPMPQPVMTPLAPTPPADTPTGVPRSAGYLLLGVGGVSLVTGAALLGGTFAVPEDTAANQSRHRAMLVSGGFLAATGAVALIGGIVITLKNRSPARVALRPFGQAMKLSAAY